MHFVWFGLVAGTAIHAANIVLSNDDGWAEMNVRTFYDSLVAAGENVVLSAPAEDKSGRGSKDHHPKPRRKPCQFDSCPAHSPPYGSDPANPRLNYVNSYPVDAMRYGITVLSPAYFGGSPDLAVAGFNNGDNHGHNVWFSGTVGAIVEAVNEGIPGIAFSGQYYKKISYREPTPLYAKVYSELSTNVTQTLLASGAPYLPPGIWLNVNFPRVDDSTCSSASDIKFILTRIFPHDAGYHDVKTCGSTNRLPTEGHVKRAKGCYASISVGHGKTTARAEEQAVVLEKLQSILSCLPH